jgi:hypothetical protein
VAFRIMSMDCGQAGVGRGADNVEFTHMMSNINRIFTIEGAAGV